MPTTIFVSTRPAPGKMPEATDAATATALRLQARPSQPEELRTMYAPMIDACEALI
jgi:hypothetical protein